MRRRDALRALAGTAGTGLAAGCLFGPRGPSAGFDLALSPLGEGLRESFTLSESAMTAPQAELVDALADEETVVGYGRQRFEDGALLRADGTYYRVSVEADGTEQIRRPVLVAEPLDRDVEDAVPVDRYEGEAYQLVRTAVGTAHRGHPEERVFYTPAERPEQLTPEPRYEYVRTHGETFRLVVAERDVSADRFVYGWTPLEGDAVEAAIRERADIVHAVDLSSGVESILDRARADPPYEATEPFSDAEEAVLDLLGVERRDVGSDERNVRYAGRFYRARVEWWHSD